MCLYGKKIGILAAFWAISVIAAGAEKRPADIVAVPDEEKARLMAEESPEQKTLRTELAAFAVKGQKIYFNSNLDGTDRIYAMSPDGSDLKCLTPSPGPGGSHPHVSPDGSRVAFGGKMTKEVASKLVPPDDKNHKIGKENSGTYVIPSTGGKPEPAALGYIAHWSPDGKKLAYMYDGIGPGRKCRYSAICDLEQKKEHTLVYGLKKLSGFFPNISPDGKYLFIAGSKGCVVELNDEGTGVAEGAKFLKKVFRQGCNEEFSKDGKWIAWVQDTYSDRGGWLHYAPFDPLKKVKGKKLPLGWDKTSVNYYPDFSPGGKYLVYSHGEQQKGFKSYTLKSKLELYVTTFPDCKVTVRITWNGGANMHPHWWGPAPTAVAKK
jgi:Tol biopolymer transport system component